MSTERARVLVTSSRMPFALDEIRKLGRIGHEVYASDTFARAPGLRSRYAHQAFVTPAPRFDAISFVERIRELVDLYAIDVILPAFEEVFYLAAAPGRLPPPPGLFAPPFETLELLHDKARFTAWASGLGLNVPNTRTVTSDKELRAAVGEIGEYFARPVFSRGGISLLTNVGPLAGALPVEECRPTSDTPWIIQEFVHGEDVCTFSVVHHGRIAAHSTYVHPHMLDHAGGITFESVQSPEALAAARMIAEASDYHGQLSLDFIRTRRGLILLECNPRPTAGVYLMSDAMFADAILNPDLDRIQSPPAGVRAKISVALVRDMLLNLRDLPRDVAALLSSGRDVYVDSRDVGPALYALLANGQIRAYRRDLGIEQHRRTDLASAYFYDVSWDGPHQITRMYPRRDDERPSARPGAEISQR